MDCGRVLRRRLLSGVNPSVGVKMPIFVVRIKVVSLIEY